MIECLLSLLLGNAMLAPTLAGRDDGLHERQNSLVCAVSVGAFRDVDDFKADVEELRNLIRALPPAPGFDEVLVPFDSEMRAREERGRTGVPVAEGTLERLRGATEGLGVELPNDIT